MVISKDANKNTNDELTYHVHPLDKNKILVRIENLADRFDANIDNSTQVKYVDLMKFAKNFWQEANPGNTQNMTIKVVEQALTNFETQAELNEELD